MMGFAFLLGLICVVSLGLLVATCVTRIPLSRRIQGALCQIILVCVGAIALIATSGL